MRLTVLTWLTCSMFQTSSRIIVDAVNKVWLTDGLFLFLMCLLVIFDINLNINKLLTTLVYPIVQKIQYSLIFYKFPVYIFTITLHFLFYFQTFFFNPVQQVFLFVITGCEKILFRIIGALHQNDSYYKNQQKSMTSLSMVSLSCQHSAC